MRWKMLRLIPLAVLAAEAAAPALSQEAPGPAAPTPPPGAAPAPPVRTLTLQDAIAIARRNNPGLQSAEENRQRAENRIAEVRANRLPQVSINGNYTYQGPTSTFTIPGQPGQPSRTVEISRATSREIGAFATLQTDLAGRIRSQQRIASLGAQSATNAVRSTENDLVYNVTSAYAGALRSQELVRVARETVGLDREQLRVSQAQFQAGVVPQFDVLSASVRVDNDRQLQIQAESTEKQAEAQLIALLNIEPATRLELAPLALPPAPITPAPTTPTPAGAPPATPAAVTASPAASDRPAEVRLAAEAPAPPVRPSTPAAAPEPPILGEDVTQNLQAAIEQAYRQRPEVLAAEEDLRSAEEAVRFERRARNPDVNLQAGYNYTPDVSGFGANNYNYHLSALLTLSVFDSGLIRSRIRQAQDVADAARANLEQVRQAVALDVRTALLNQREGELRRTTTASNVTQAREALRIANVRYQAGVSTIVEVTDAQVALARAQINQVNADYDLIVAQSAVQRALGEYAGTGKGPPAPPKE
jgi:outer membrane protein